MRNRLVEVGQGIWVNPADERCEEKMMRYGKLVPNSPLHEASILTSAGKYREAKAIYRKLLDVKESFYVHQQLAPLCGLAEALRMAQMYRSKKVRALYFDRVLQIDPDNKQARRFFAGRFQRALAWFLVLLLLAMLALAAFLFARHYVDLTTTTVTNSTYNQVEYVDKLQAEQYSNTITVAEGLSPDAIAKAVDIAKMQPGDTDLIASPSNKPIGYATYPGKSSYQIYLLRQPTSQGTPNNSPPPVSPITLNAARSAYTYYLQTHNGHPPASLNDLLSLMPPGVPLSDLAYHPDAVTPENAITEPNGAQVPFERPYILVDTTNKRLFVKYGPETLLSSAVGVGRPDQPTPIGLFTVTDHMRNAAKPVYGPYIFPLNHSEFAIHGTDNPAKVGKEASIGCVELPNDIDTKLYHMIPVGTPVIITNKSDGKVPNPTEFRG